MSQKLATVWATLPLRIDTEGDRVIIFIIIESDIFSGNDSGFTTEPYRFRVLEWDMPPNSSGNCRSIHFWGVLGLHPAGVTL